MGGGGGGNAHWMRNSKQQPTSLLMVEISNGSPMRSPAKSYNSFAQFALVKMTHLPAGTGQIFSSLQVHCPVQPAHMYKSVRCAVRGMDQCERHMVQRE